MTEASKGDIVRFKPQTDDIYSWEIPEIGSTGSIVLLTHNVGLDQMLGVYLPMCVVDFGLETYTPVYLEDLRLVQKNKNTDIDISLNPDIN